ncbi:hypothetical protein EDD18DRAFT_1010999, partial [Armillaria luteobubalina]
LTLQETHLSEKHIEDIHNLYEKRLLIINSKDPENVTGKAGVTVVLNRNQVKMENVKTTELILGCALLVQIPWHADTVLNWLAIYVSATSKEENRDMWKELAHLWAKLSLPQFDSMSGNFNFVKEAIDCFPAHEDDAALVTAFQEFKLKLCLHDGWRDIHPTGKDYTFVRQSPPFSRSRIDHIY